MNFMIVLNEKIPNYKTQPSTLKDRLPEVIALYLTTLKETLQPPAEAPSLNALSLDDDEKHAAPPALDDATLQKLQTTLSNELASIANTLQDDYPALATDIHDEFTRTFKKFFCLPDADKLAHVQKRLWQRNYNFESRPRVYLSQAMNSSSSSFFSLSSVTTFSSSAAGRQRTTLPYELFKTMTDYLTISDTVKLFALSKMNVLAPNMQRGMASRNAYFSYRLKSEFGYTISNVAQARPAEDIYCCLLALEQHQPYIKQCHPYLANTKEDEYDIFNMEQFQHDIFKQVFFNYIAAGQGDPAIDAASLGATDNATALDYLNRAAEMGNLSLVRWLTDEARGQMRVTPNQDTLDNAAKSGNLPLVQWLTDEARGQMRVMPNLNTLAFAENNEHWPIVQWLTDDSRGQMRVTPRRPNTWFE